MHRIPLALLLACVILPPSPAAQASEHDQVSLSAPAATGKERLRAWGKITASSVPNSSGVE